MRIIFGALEDSLVTQLDGSGIPVGLLELFELDSQAITRLWVRGLITDSQIDASRKKLIKNIETARSKAATALERIRKPAIF